MQASEIHEALRSYIIETLLHGEAGELDDESPLLEWGVIDSLAMVGLLAFIQAKFGVRVPDRDVSPRNFATIAALQRMILRELAGGSSHA